MLILIPHKFVHYASLYSKTLNFAIATYTLISFCVFFKFLQLTVKSSCMMWILTMKQSCLSRETRRLGLQSRQ